MTSISNMDLPDDVVEKVDAAILRARLAGRLFRAKAAIRATLQAMVDNGMARIETYSEVKSGAYGKVYSVLIIRLDTADERKRKEQKP